MTGPTVAPDRDPVTGKLSIKAALARVVDVLMEDLGEQRALTICRAATAGNPGPTINVPMWLKLMARVVVDRNLTGLTTDDQFDREAAAVLRAIKSLET